VFKLEGWVGRESSGAAGGLVALVTTRLQRVGAAVQCSGTFGSGLLSGDCCWQLRRRGNKHKNRRTDRAFCTRLSDAK
jgi:hypothetical protein